MLKKFREKLPILSCIIVIIIYLRIFHLSAIGISFVLQSSFSIQLVSMLITDVFLLVILWGMGFGNVLRQKSRGLLYSVGTGGYMIFVGTVALVSNLAMYILTEDNEFRRLVPAWDIFIFILTMLGIGFTEELVFRGIVTNILKEKFSIKSDKGIYLVIVIQGVLFGACHITNALSGVGLESAFVQAVMASFLGMILGAIYLRTNSLWFVMLLHAWNDFGGLAATGFFGVSTIADNISSYTWRNLAGLPVYLIVLLVLLRVSKREEIKDGMIYPASLGVRIAKGLVLSIVCVGFLALVAVVMFLSVHSELFSSI